MLILLLSFFSTLSFSEDSITCQTPRQVMMSLLDNLQPNSYSPEKSIQCMPGASTEIAIQMKRIIDSRGIFVAYESIPDDINFETEENVPYLFSEDAPEIMITKGADGWSFSQDTISAIPNLYDKSFSTRVESYVNMLPPIFFSHFFGFYLWQALFLILLIALAVSVGRLADFLLISQFLKYAKRFGIRINETLMNHMRFPLIWIAIGVVLYLGTPELQLSIRPSQILIFLSKALISMAVVLLLSRITDILSNVLSEKAAKSESRFDDQIIPLLSRATKTFIWVFGLIFILQNLGIEVTALLALGSVSGVAVALASKDTVENLFGSVVVFVDQPFQIGDWVIIDGNIEGVVEEVGFRSTRIRSFVTSLISVPNAKIANSTVDNFGKRRFRRYQTTLTLRYDSKAENIKEYMANIYQFLEENEHSEAGSTHVYFNNMGPHSLDILVRTYLTMDDYVTEQKTIESFHFYFMDLATRHHLEFAFPTQTLELESPKSIEIKTINT